MSQDSFTRVTQQSWFGRLGESIKGIVAGLLMLVVSFPLLIWNEGRAVTTAKSLEEGAAAVVSISPDSIDPAHESKLIHTTGEATTEETLKDPEFGIAVKAIKLRRQVKMYQWKEKKDKETRKKLGGGTETIETISYSREWSEDVIPSGNFQQPSRHQNPPQMKYSPGVDVASKVTLGKFTLSSDLVAQMTGWTSREITDKDLSETKEDLRSRLKVHNGAFWEGDPEHPEVGDMQVHFLEVRPGTVSVIAKQSGDHFAPYHTAAGRDLQILKPGAQSAQEMFHAAMQQNTITTWLLRGLGFVVMWIGLALVFRPLAVVGAVIPFLGDLLGLGIGIVSGLIAAIISLITIAIGWFAFRPIIGIAVLVPAVILIVLLFRASRKGRKPATA